ncbi:hypothetical protein NITGR_160051 [Nitrospina gracilis 3/211]|uniref:Uncharacterized protein n=1 Tax=Nitrospina gracilis (strain 3/211) TaxID=1266370 RepID=M1YWS4_NITG3|nr:hypothetical protein NITGR_160051 [Nitrospina gracilis 3/211]
MPESGEKGKIFQNKAGGAESLLNQGDSGRLAESVERVPGLYPGAGADFGHTALPKTKSQNEAVLQFQAVGRLSLRRMATALRANDGLRARTVSEADGYCPTVSAMVRGRAPQ